MVFSGDGLSEGFGAFSVDRRQKEIRRLLALMGGSVAALYEDACRLLSAEPELASASHLVGHLAREIESAVRKLLTALVPPARIAVLPREPGEDDPRWKDVVDEICTALGFATEDEVRTLWKAGSWHNVAHRSGLLGLRAVDDQFRSTWRQFEVLLFLVGRQYEGTYTAALHLVDELASIDRPTKGDLSRLRHQVPHGGLALRRFFERAGAGWFDLLRGARYFDAPPHRQRTQDDVFVYESWPVARYLLRMAKVASLSHPVLEIAMNLDTDDPEAVEVLAEIALTLPAEMAALLTPRLALPLSQSTAWAPRAKAGEVVVSLAAAQYAEAASLYSSRCFPLRLGAREAATPPWT
jgi:hypothetical protein